MKWPKNSLLKAVLIGYTIIILISGAIVVKNDFTTRWNAHLEDAGKVLISLSNEYESMTGNFWRYYLPLVAPEGRVREKLDNYFSTSDELSPIDRQQLTDALKHFGVYFEPLKWIALESSGRETNYLFRQTSDDGNLDILPDDFPFSEAFSLQYSFMKVLGSRYFLDETCFAVVGGAPLRSTHDKMIFGFSVRSLDRIVSNADSAYNSLCYAIAEDGELIYSSLGLHGDTYLASSRTYQSVNSTSGRLIVWPVESSPRQSICYFTISYSELFWKTCSEVYHSLIVLFVLLVLSISMLLLFSWLVNREVSAIQRGLKRIGDNHLDHRFTLHFHNDGFNDVAQAINVMAEELQNTVERSYQFELRQREAEMAELLAKFDPHFLYNTLELFRSRCLSSGDETTAELISHAAQLFRGLLSSKRIVTVQEELTFNEHYLRLYRGRYGEQTRILYDFDSSILNCLIMRNILQPLIENYFEHGFDGSRSDNYLQIRGDIISNKEIRLTVQDNGRGISDEKITNLRTQLADPVINERESYGLKNLHQRIQLYYGKEFGLMIDRSPDNGLAVSILLPIISQPPVTMPSIRETGADDSIKKAVTSVSDPR